MIHISSEMQSRLDQVLAEMAQSNFVARFWQRDGSLWSEDPEVQAFIGKFMGWTDIPEAMIDQADSLVAFAQEVKEEGFTDLVVCGMGGSSLSSLVFAQAFPNSTGLKIHVLDSTDAATVTGLLDRLPMLSTLFVVASKSGTTAEPKSFEEFFYAKMVELTGEKAGRNFVAITDPGSAMLPIAEERGYRKVFLGVPEIGGRFSVLSVFGLLTAAAMQLDVKAMVTRAAELGPARGDTLSDPFRLGALLGELSLAGRDKVTFITPPHLEAFGLWAEQLIAESTGKGGKGILPVAQEPVGAPENYGDDRVFVLLTDGSDIVQGVTAVEVARETGAPVILRTIANEADLAEEFYSWEVATAVAGAVLGVNPFDQPNVQEAKTIAQGKLAEIQRTGTVEMGVPTMKEGLLTVYHGQGTTIPDALKAWLNEPVSHLSFLAFIPETAKSSSLVQGMRQKLRDATKKVTSFGYGPRYLHSTGQFHKGGPNNGAFLILTGGDSVDAQIPGMGASFNQLKNAQALGDIGALQANGRFVLHIDLGVDSEAGLEALAEKIEEVLR
ncbi:MAG: hypothetical protein MUC92_09810 [Fimbriimonadaceae bacterium]|jgi:glucose-6-phosphate isomerase|nr:hypothetical protein [Fimbriimonadaceae bacterium]